MRRLTSWRARRLPILHAYLRGPQRSRSPLKARRRGPEHRHERRAEIWPTERSPCRERNTRHEGFKRLCGTVTCGRCRERDGELGQNVVRIGAFPNITHPQAMVGKNEGWFEKALGSGIKIDWKSFNAGPSAIEALFAGALDITYIGPNPAITGYVRS